MKLKENTRHKGYWWLPSDSENKIRGELIYSNEQPIELYLDGDFNKNTRKAIFQVDAVLGKLDDYNMPVSLLNSFVSSSKSRGDIYSSVIVSNYLITGQHFNNIDDVLIDNFSYSFTD